MVCSELIFPSLRLASKLMSVRESTEAGKPTDRTSSPKDRERLMTSLDAASRYGGERLRPVGGVAEAR